MRKNYIFSALAFLCLSQFSFAQQPGTWLQQDLLPFGYNPNNWIQFVDVVDSNTCWGLSSDRNGQTNPMQEAINTTDGGNTWTVHPITNATGLGPSCIMALNADTAWTAMFNPAGGGQIMRTNDGGVTWTWQNTATFTPPNGFPNIVHFFDANNGICMGDPNGGYFEIYTTVDGGTNWVRTQQANIPANQSGEFGITDVYTALGSSTLWFGTNHGRIYKTTDAGFNWTVASTPYAGFLGGISFKDANYGLAVEADLATVNTDVIVTTDGGATWNILPTITGNVGQKQQITFVPGTDSTFVFTSPYNRTAAPIRDFGSGFSTNGGTDWWMVDQGAAAALHSDNDFTSPTSGWTGGLTPPDPIFGLFRDPVMFKWTGALYIPLLEVQPVSVDMFPAISAVATTNPIGTVKNNSLYKGSFNVTLTIPGGYSSTKSVTIPNAQATAQVVFDPWTPGTPNNYVLTLHTQLAGDEDTTNDYFANDVNALNEFQNYGWTSLGPVDTGRFGISSAFYYDGVYPNGNSYLYALGGANGTVRTLNDMYDPTSNTWATQAPMTIQRYQVSSHIVNGKIYVIGGYSGGFTPEPTTEIYDIASTTWTTGAPMPTPVGDYASGVYNDSLIYYIGGFDGTGDVNLVQIYDTYNDIWTTGTAKTGTASAGLRGGIYQNKIVVAGGYSQLSGGPIREARMGTINTANPSSIVWSTIADYPGKEISRLGAGAVYKESLPLIGFTGGDPTGLGVQTYALTLAYDLNQNEWLIGPDKPTSTSNISDFVGTVYNDSLWLASVGGYDGTAILAVNEWLNMGHYTPVGIPHINSDNTGMVSLFPNPANNSLMVEVEKWNSMKSISITDVTGREVIKVNALIAQRNQIDISKLNSGIYFVQLLDGNDKIAGSVKFSKL